MKEKGIIFLLFIFIMSFVGCGNSVTTSNIPKDMDEEIYIRSVEMLAYTERCFNNHTEANGEKYEKYSEELKQICKQQNREMTDKEMNSSDYVILAGLKLLYYQTENKQDALDYYQKHVKEAKELLNIPVDKDSNEVWNEIKNK